MDGGLPPCSLFGLLRRWIYDERNNLDDTRQGLEAELRDMTQKQELTTVQEERFLLDIEDVLDALGEKLKEMASEALESVDSHKREEERESNLESHFGEG